MISLRSWATTVFLKIYVAVVLIIATVLSPLALSFVPVLLLVWHLYLWRWPITPVMSLLTELFCFFAIALLFVSPVGPLFSLLIALPVLLLVNRGLEETGETVTYRDTRYVRSLTDVGLTLLLITGGVLGVGLLVGNPSLLLAAAAVIGYFGFLGAVILRQLPLKPVEETQIQQRMVAGTEAHLNIELTTSTGIGGLLFLESPYEWLKVSPKVLPLKESAVARVSLSPLLSGPSVVKLRGQATDRWGLVRVTFELEPIRLYVIPRARYAAWLAKRYLSETEPGALPLISDIAILKPMHGLRRGVEYYGSQLYQPGDSLKNIDWKHSLKYNELISKEFAEFQGRPAVILINLAAGDAEEADKLAHDIIVTGMSLAQEGIPAALAAYNHECVALTTAVLPPQHLVLRCLQVAKEMVTFVNPVKYLSPPDVARLRANISRVRFAEGNASRVLAQLLQLEYDNLSNGAKHHPATKALSEVLAKVDKKSSIVVVSRRNHDAEALAFNTFSFSRKGNAVISL